MAEEKAGESSPGMSNRESFSQAAMNGFLRSPYWNLAYPDPTTEPTLTALRTLVHMSVATADMLIEELAKPVATPGKK